ncbi:MAG: cyclic nucleotide-binding domain-containing protein [Magnetococcales bacterium]|nr:cyclic nucleotide-binding domain-containing protein [Magnetococcales bacterium]
MLFHQHENTVGRKYNDGEVIIRQGEEADTMFVILKGAVEVVAYAEDDPAGELTVLAVLEQDEVFGEMSCFDKLPRSASVRARGKARVLTVDSKGFLQRIQADPALAMRIFKKLSERIRTLNAEIVKLKAKTKDA